MHKITLFRVKIFKIFLRWAEPLPGPPPVARGTVDTPPFSTPYSLGAYSAPILAPTALDTRFKNPGSTTA